MTIPTGGAATVYASSSKWSDSRVIMGVRYPAWTQAFAHTFTTLPHALFRTSPIPPLADGGGLHFRNYYDGHGVLVTPFEEVIHRPGQIPTDLTKAFKITIAWEVGVADPQYDQGFAIYGLDGTFGAPSDPLRVVFHGSVTYPNHPGVTILYPPGQFPQPSSVSDLVIPYDALTPSHEIVLTWDPAAVDTLTIALDTVQVWAGAGTRPYGIGYGLVWTESRETTAGTPGTFADVLTIASVGIDQVATGGFETRLFPGWTSTNATATTHDNAAPGERYDLDGETWARFPEPLIADWSTDGEVFSATLVPAADDPDVLHWKHWKHRPILLDTRINAASGNTGWKRLIAGRIEKVNTSVNANGVPRVVISGRAIPHLKLANTVPNGYVQSAAETPGIQRNLNFEAVFEDIAEIGDFLDGSTLETGTDINVPAISPLSLNGGAQELLANWREWTDRLVQQAWVRYAATGDDRYGTLVTHLWDTEPGTPYAFTVGNGVAASVDDDDRNGPGQVQIHPNLARAASADWMFLGKPHHATYPTYPYPAHAFTFGDSVGYTNGLGVGPLIAFPDRTGANRAGGQAKLRLYAEISRERTISLRVVDHDWMQPGDTISFDGSTYLDTDETWVIERVSYRMGANGLEASIDAFSTDIVGVMTR